MWFQRDLKPATRVIAEFLADHFSGNTSDFRICSTCLRDCRKSKIPVMSITNGYKYPPKPSGLFKLDSITERLISPRIAFIQIRRLRQQGDYGIIGQVINVSVDVDTMVRSLPRSLDDDYAFNVNVKKNIMHKSSYISGFVKKSTVQAWLQFLVEQPLYKHYNIKVDLSVSKNSIENHAATAASEGDIETFNEGSVPESELIVSRQQKLSGPRSPRST